MNKKFLTATCLIALAIILGKQEANAFMAPAQPGAPETFMVTDIQASTTTRGCTEKVPCKFLGSYVDDVRVVCISQAAATKAAGASRLTASGAHFNYRLEMDKYRCFAKFLPAESADGAKLYCASGSIAQFQQPDNNWDFKFKSLGRIAIQNPESSAITTVAISPSSCFVYYEGNGTLNEKLGIFGNTLPTAPINNNVTDAYVIEDNTTNPRVSGRPYGITPTIAVTKAVNYLKTGVK